MIEESVVEELEERGYSVRKVVKSTQECTKLVADDADNRYFVKCYPLREIFRTTGQKKVINNELTMAENFKKWDLNTCTQFVKRVYTKTTLFMFFTFHRHITLETLLTLKPLTPQQIVLLLRDLLAIIYELRGAGVLHRHLSPDKIIVTSNQLKFCAFKYCTPIKKAKYETDEYMYLARNMTNLYCVAPEVLLNEFTGFKTQIFSFGVLAYLITHLAYPYLDPSGDTKLLHLKNAYTSGTAKTVSIHPRLTEDMFYLLQNTLQVAYSDRMSLSEVKVSVGSLYKQIVHEEETIRQKLYNTMNPAIKIDDVAPPKQALKELLFVPKPKTGRPTNASLPALGKPTAGPIMRFLDQQEERVGPESSQHNNSELLAAQSLRKQNASHLELLLHRSQKLQVRPVRLGFGQSQPSERSTVN